MLAQKIALETDERGALAVANRFFPVSLILSRRMTERISHARVRITNPKRG